MTKQEIEKFVEQVIGESELFTKFEDVLLDQYGIYNLVESMCEAIERRMEDNPNLKDKINLTVLKETLEYLN